MNEDGAPGKALETFAQRHGLSFSATTDLPEEGALLGSKGEVHGAATGQLPGGTDGSLAFYSYIYTDSDQHTHTRTFTILVTRVPESIGFVPYLMFSGADSAMGTQLDQSPEPVELEEGDALKGAGLYAYKGTSRAWLTELFSPAMIDWLARSPEDFGFELCDGVLVVGRNGYVTAASELETHCDDAAHIADALRRESVEETESGGAKRSAAKAVDEKTAAIRSLAGEVELSAEPEDVAAAKAEFHRFATRTPGIWLGGLIKALGITLVINFFGAAVPIILSVNGQLALLAAIECGVVLIVFFFVFRSGTRRFAETAAEEAFVRRYAEGRKLKIEDPLAFAATHAEAKIPFKPERVLSGVLPGGTNGSLAWEGTGMKRSDRIAVIAGPEGPLASAELEATAPGLSAEDLDGYAERLSSQLGEARPAAAR